MRHDGGAGAGGSIGQDRSGAAEVEIRRWRIRRLCCCLSWA
jgi:hypothetical protein